MSLMTRWVLWLWLASGIGFAVAQPPAGPVAPNRNDLTSLAGQVEVARLVDLAAERLRVRVAYDAAALKAAGSDRKSTRLNSSHIQKSRMPSSA